MPNPPDSISVRCCSQLEADAAAKLVTAMRSALAAGLLADSWTFRVFRHNGGRVRVEVTAEAPQTIDRGILD
jgi:hypothetical protein